MEGWLAAPSMLRILPVIDYKPTDYEPTDYEPTTLDFP